LAVGKKKDKGRPGSIKKEIDFKKLGANLGVLEERSIPECREQRRGRWMLKILGEQIGGDFQRKKKKSSSHLLHAH